MKTLKTLLLISLIAVLGCRGQRQQQPGQDNKTQMLLDSAVSGKDVKVVQPKESVRPDEAITDFKQLPNIMQYDIEALQRTPSKEVVYVKPGESLRPSEQTK
jgi:hypothetical protein